MRIRSTLAKKCSLLRTIGPPTVKPHSVLPTSGFSRFRTLLKKFFELSALLVVGLNAVVEKFLARHEHDAGYVARKRHVVAVLGRKVVQLLRRDVAADLDRRDVHERRFTRDGESLGEAAHFQDEIERRRLADREGNAAPVQRLEPFELGADAIASRHDLRHGEAAFGAGNELAEDTGVFVGHDDVDARKDAALRVGDLSGN